MTIPLFERFPRLERHVPYLPLGSWPTPVRELARLSRRLGTRVFVKCDDRSAVPYGGNKVRKLEFSLGRALAGGARTVITFGCAGSNHALTTAMYARAHNLFPVSVLMPQPNAAYVRRNLLRHLATGARMEAADSWPQSLSLSARLAEEYRGRDGAAPLIIAAGGSSAEGVLGFVNAAFELKAQIDGGLLPRPDRIYVTLGTMGTAAGLFLGCGIAGIDTIITAVRVVPAAVASAGAFHALCAQTRALLAAAGCAGPETVTGGPDIRGGWLGAGYAEFSREGMDAVAMAAELEQLHLDGTYTGKTMAALIGDAQQGVLRGKTVLFWNTLNSVPSGQSAAAADFRLLPAPFHRYFTEPLQPLDPDR